MMGEDNANVQQQQVEKQYRAYPSRFYVLVVAALFAMHQNIAWLTFGPIPDRAKEMYGLTDIELTLLPGAFHDNKEGAKQCFTCLDSLCKTKEN